MAASLTAATAEKAINIIRSSKGFDRVLKAVSFHTNTCKCSSS